MIIMWVENGSEGEQIIGRTVSSCLPTPGEKIYHRDMNERITIYIVEISYHNLKEITPNRYDDITMQHHATVHLVRRKE